MHFLTACFIKVPFFSKRWGALPDKNGQKQKFWVSEYLGQGFEADEKNLKSRDHLKSTSLLSFTLSASFFISFTLKCPTLFYSLSGNLYHADPQTIASPTSISKPVLSHLYLWFFLHCLFCFKSYSIFLSVIKNFYEESVPFDVCKWKSVKLINCNC